MTDVDDQPPVFEQTMYSATVDEVCLHTTLGFSEFDNEIFEIELS